MTWRCSGRRAPGVNARGRCSFAVSRKNAGIVALRPTRTAWQISTALRAAIDGHARLGARSRTAWRCSSRPRLFSAPAGNICTWRSMTGGDSRMPRCCIQTLRREWAYRTPYRSSLDAPRRFALFAVYKHQRPHASRSPWMPFQEAAWMNNFFEIHTWDRDSHLRPRTKPNCRLSVLSVFSAAYHSAAHSAAAENGSQNPYDFGVSAFRGRSAAHPPTRCHSAAYNGHQRGGKR